jgi:CubicO group peptidase (beta-lactamase class C family)
MPLWLALLACGPQADFPDPIASDGRIARVSTPAADVARYELAADWSEDHHGLALIVVEGDSIVFERYAPGWDATAPHHLFSGTKTFACALVQAAVANGDVTSLDERVADVLPEFDVDGKRDITVRHLLSFTSGLTDARWALTVDGLRADQRVDDKAAVAVAQDPWAEAGTTFSYASVHLWVLAAWFQARTGQDPVDYLDAHVFDALDFDVSGWIRDPSGTPALPYGAFTTAEEWAKFGVLLRDDGEFLGERVLPVGLLAECAVGSAANPAYGLTTWLNQETDAVLDPVGGTLATSGPILYPDGPTDLFAAAGAQDQRLYVIPSRDLVIVRLGDGDRRFEDPELLARVLDGADPPGCATAPLRSGPGWALLALAVAARRRLGARRPPESSRTGPERHHGPPRW